MAPDHNNYYRMSSIMCAIWWFLFFFSKKPGWSSPRSAGPKKSKTDEVKCASPLLPRIYSINYYFSVLTWGEGVLVIITIVGIKGGGWSTVVPQMSNPVFQ